MSKRDQVDDGFESIVSDECYTGVAVDPDYIDPPKDSEVARSAVAKGDRCERGPGPTERSIAHGAPRRAAVSFHERDGGVVVGRVSYGFDGRDVPVHGEDEQWSNEGTDLPKPLQQHSDGVAETRASSGGGFSHGSRAATGWSRKDAQDTDQSAQFDRLHSIQHDQFAVRDSESDHKHKLRREGLYSDLTNLGLRGADRQRAYYLATKDEYRGSSWARQHGGFDGLAIGYAAVIAFESEAEAREAIVDGSGFFREVATDIRGDELEALGAVTYGFRRARERGEL